MQTKSPGKFIVLAIVIGFVCGFLGLLLRNLAEATPPFGYVAAVLDTFHQTILLIAPDSHYADLPSAQDTWCSGLLVMIGRLLLPIGVILAIAGGLKTVWQPAWHAFRARRRHGHIVVAGLGQRGHAFAMSALSAGLKVTSLNHSGAQKLAKGHLRLQRDATAAAAWHDIALDRAKATVLALPTDEANLAALSAILQQLKQGSGLSARGNGPMTIHVALENAQTRQAFLENEDALKPFPGCEVRPYSVSELIARRFFRDVPLHARARQLGQTCLHLVFAGRGPVNQALLLQFLKICPAWGFDRPKLSLVSDAPEAWHGELLNDYPGIETLAEFDMAAWPMSNAHPATDNLKRIEDGAPITAIFVDLGESEHNAVAARLLRAFCRREAVWHAPIYFQARRGANLAHFFDETGDDVADPILPLSSIDEVCTLTAIDGTDDRDARNVHQKYLKKDPDGMGPALQPWQELAETHRAACRRAADFLPVLEESLNAQELVVAGKSVGPADIALDRAALEKSLEHASWYNERTLQGWRYGEMRDEVRLRHPDLLPRRAKTSGCDKDP